MKEQQKQKKHEDKSELAIAGGLMIGLGVGFFFLQTSVFAFVGCILAGLGLGLIISPIIALCGGAQKGED